MQGTCLTRRKSGQEEVALLRGTPRHGLLSPRTHAATSSLWSPAHVLWPPAVWEAGAAAHVSRTRPLLQSGSEGSSSQQGEADQSRDKWLEQGCLSRQHRRPLTEVLLSQSRTGQTADLGGAKVAGESRSCEVSLPPPCPAVGFQGHPLLMPFLFWQQVCPLGKNVTRTLFAQMMAQHFCSCVFQKKIKWC